MLLLIVLYTTRKNVFRLHTMNLQCSLHSANVHRPISNTILQSEISVTYSLQILPLKGDVGKVLRPTERAERSRRENIKSNQVRGTVEFTRSVTNGVRNK